MSARADLCGGRSAMIVPTATVSRDSRAGKVRCPEVVNRDFTVLTMKKLGRLIQID